MKVEHIVRQCGLSQAHLDALASAVPLGYRALRELVKTTPMLGQFQPGTTTVGYLRNLAVQHALDTQAATTGLFFTEMAFNKPRNHSFLQLRAAQVVITAHYSGATGTRTLRKAISRAELSKRNGDLFAREATEADADLERGQAYVQLRHGGVANPVFAALYIPNRNQQSYLHEPMLLELAPPEAAQVEMVADKLDQAIKRKVREGQRERDAG
jgi:hypothetical protein